MKVTSKLNLILFLIIIVLLSLTSCSGIVGPEIQLDYVYLDVPYEKYAETNWCLPASGAMVFKYFGLDVSQIEIANEVIKNEKSSISKFVTFAEDLGFNAEYRYKTIKGIKNLLKQGIPVIAIQYYSLTLSYVHARVVIGFDDENQELITNDPTAGENYKISYTDFSVLNLDGNFDRCNVVIIFPNN